MPDAWSRKDERKYEHIKESYEERGISEDEAEERAARTVNRDRSREGRTLEQEARGGPTRAQLYTRAKRLDIEGRSRMNKAELARAVAQRDSDR